MKNFQKNGKGIWLLHDIWLGYFKFKMEKNIYIKKYNFIKNYPFNFLLNLEGESKILRLDNNFRTHCEQIKLNF